MLISNAWAADLDAAATEPGILTSLLPLLLVFVIFYFLILRPQNKRIAQHRNMVSSLRRGDRVVTAGGVIGTVKKLVGDDELVVEIADKVQITVVRSTLMSMRNVRPANDATPAKKKKDTK